MLTRMQDGMYHLEDPYAHIPLEFPSGVSCRIYASLFGPCLMISFPVGANARTVHGKLLRGHRGNPDTPTNDAGEGNRDPGFGKQRNYRVCCLKRGLRAEAMLIVFFYECSKTFKHIDFFGAPKSIQSYVGSLCC